MPRFLEVALLTEGQQRQKSLAESRQL